MGKTEGWARLRVKIKVKERETKRCIRFIRYKDKKAKKERKGLIEFRVIVINGGVMRIDGVTWCENMLQAWYIVTYSYQQALRTCKNRGHKFEHLL